jgi:CRISPR-associated endonuclease Csn1
MTKLGIDLGSSSLGWTLRDGNEFKKKGVITFNSGMVKGQGGYTSPTRDRREARSKRRLIQARKYRKWELLKVLIGEYVPLSIIELEKWSKYQKGQTRKFPENENFKKWLSCDFTYLKNGNKYQNPYDLRVKSLDFNLTKHELGRVLYHLVQRRGYKDIGETDKETQNQIDRRDESGLKDALERNRTLGEALKKGFLEKGKRARNEYPFRNEYEEELFEILKSQNFNISKDENGTLTDDFVNNVRKSIIWQRPLRSQKGTIGKCTLEPNVLRSPISHPIFEIYRAWSFINTIKYFDENGVKKSLDKGVRKKLFDNLFLKKDRFKFEDVKKFLDKDFGKKQKYNYPIDSRTGKYETSVSGMPVCKEMIKIFGDKIKGYILNLDENTENDAPNFIKNYSVYDIWHAVFHFDEEYLEKLAKTNFKIGNVEVTRNKKKIEISPLVLLKKSLMLGYADLSLKVMRKIIPFLREGFIYNKAVLLAKLPELLDDKWDDNKDLIINVINDSNEKYNFQKTIVSIANKLIEKHKALEYPNNFAYKDFDYILDSSDENDICGACEGYFGEKTWESIANRNIYIQEVGLLYQEYFSDSKRAYRETQTLKDLVEKEFKELGLYLNGELYHHSMRKNIYGNPIKYNKSGVMIDVLPEPRIDSIRNPMFNKSMSILRKLINELIVSGDIDNDTEIIIEIARELNDNNKRAAIERFQNQRKSKREKYRAFLNEFKERENSSINVDQSISTFELWSEQIFDDKEGKNIKELRTDSILNEKDALKRYELWTEQKGQCIYTGKMISISQLFSNEIDIEHTVPRSILPDNTMANQTVCYAKYNRDVKKNKIPYDCENFSISTPNGSSIELRLDVWKQIRDNYKELFEKRRKPFGGEDENKKNKRIQEKHFYRMHFDYWRDKINRFEAKEIKDSWARRQLVDTQMVSKYAREFLKTYFKKVSVQKGQVTAEFRKMFGFQEEDEIKSRNKHTHHAIDAAVLTLIPVNSSKREEILKKHFEAKESGKKVSQMRPFKDFNSQNLIKNIENNILIVNYQKDKIIQQTKKVVRNRGEIEYLKNKKGDFILNEDGGKVKKTSQGDSIRSTLFKQTYIGKIKAIERDENGKPVRENGNWKYKTGDDEFIYTERKPIKEVLKKTIDIVDPDIRKLVEKQKGNDDIFDFQGNKMRHVRIKVRAGKKVKERINYRSKHEHKNHFYSASGSIPYAVMLHKNEEDTVERKMIPISSYQIAKVFRKTRKFDEVEFVKEYYPEYESYDKKLLKIGQKVFVLQDDEEYNQRIEKEFQRNRFYKITQFKYDGSKIMLQYHLEAQSKSDIDKSIKADKNDILMKYEKSLNIPLITLDKSIIDNNDRNKDYEKRLFDFNKRLKTLENKAGKDLMSKAKKEIEIFKTESSSILAEELTPPILGLSLKNWNFLYEDYDFSINLKGEIKWIE